MYEIGHFPLKTCNTVSDTKRNTSELVQAIACLKSGVMTFPPSERDLVVCTAKVDSAEDPVLSYGIYLIIYTGKLKSI